MARTSDVLLVEQHEHVRIIRLNRPEKKNALSDELGWAIIGAVEEAACDDEVWVVGITGAGDAFCSGLSLAMAADIRLASTRARFLAGYARAGTSPDGGLSWTLPHLLGYERALRFLLEQRMHSADEALALGLVGEVVDADSFDERLLEYCGQLAALSPIAARQTKQMVMQGLFQSDLHAQCREEIAKARRGLATEDGKEAVRAIMQKRPPVFGGR